MPALQAPKATLAMSCFLDMLRSAFGNIGNNTAPAINKRKEAICAGGNPAAGLSFGDNDNFMSKKELPHIAANKKRTYHASALGRRDTV